jgi:hypothetical protein
MIRVVLDTNILISGGIEHHSGGNNLGCPTSRAFREVGRDAADTGGFFSASHLESARRHRADTITSLVCCHVEQAGALLRCRRFAFHHL